MKHLLGGLGVSVLLASTPAVGSAQVKVGGTLAWHDDFDFGVGAWVSTPIEAISEEVAGAAEFLYFFPDEGGPNVDVSYWEINTNLYYSIAVESETFAPYAGAGLNIAHVSVSSDTAFGDFEADDTDLGLNILAGTSFRGPAFEPFVELRIELGGGEGFVLSAGAALPIFD